MSVVHNTSILNVHGAAGPVAEIKITKPKRKRNRGFELFCKDYVRWYKQGSPINSVSRVEVSKAWFELNPVERTCYHETARIHKFLDNELKQLLQALAEKEGENARPKPRKRRLGPAVKVTITVPSTRRRRRRVLLRRPTPAPSCMKRRPNSCVPKFVTFGKRTPRSTLHRH